MTLQTALTGVYRPLGRAEWDNGIEWQPIPYTIDNTVLNAFLSNSTIIFYISIIYFRQV